MPTLKDIKKNFGTIQRVGAIPFSNWLLHRTFLGRTSRNFVSLRSFLLGKNGLEIGGPSGVFLRNSLLPIYEIVIKCDNLNFANNTLWEKQLTEGLTFCPQGKILGHQYVLDATNLIGIPDDVYDFVLSSHVIEHIANPIKALKEWKRVLKPGGILLLVVPHKQGTFDHNRKVTAIGHLVRDMQDNVQESDMTHLPEVLRYHDLALDPDAGSYENLARRSQDNFKLRALHHHVFDTSTAIRLLDLVGFKILSVFTEFPVHIVLLGRKVAEEMATREQNLDVLGSRARWRKSSIFKSDRQGPDGEEDQPEIVSRIANGQGKDEERSDLSFTRDLSKAVE